MAAHLEGKGATVLDFTGFAQKGGSVISYIRLANSSDDLKTIRIGTGKANLLLGCDQVVASSPEALRTLEEGVSTVVLNTEKTQTAQFVLSRDADIHSNIIAANLKKMVGSDALFQIGASKIATAIMGNSIATNSFLMGFAWQKGQIPLSLEAIGRAIELNNVAIDFNKQAFDWGRIAAHDVKILEKTSPISLQDDEILTDLDDIINYRANFLSDYQDNKLSEKYRAAITKIRTLEENTITGSEKLSLAVAKNYFKLLAIKDEFEVARLYTDGRFEKKLAEQFEGDYKLKFHMAPPIIARKNSKGELQKMEIGGWMFHVLKLTAKMRFLRGTWFDFMGKSDERKMERRLITDYEELMAIFENDLRPDNLDKAAELARIPQDIRGYGHVKEKSVKLMDIKRKNMIDEFKAPLKKTKDAA
jgi:indolepyruvate ferredoxin oxidoreductase